MTDFLRPRKMGETGELLYSFDCDRDSVKRR